MQPDSSTRRTGQVLTVVRSVSMVIPFVAAVGLLAGFQQLRDYANRATERSDRAEVYARSLTGTWDDLSGFVATVRRAGAERVLVARQDTQIGIGFVYQDRCVTVLASTTPDGTLLVMDTRVAFRSDPCRPPLPEKPAGEPAVTAGSPASSGLVSRRG